MVKPAAVMVNLLGQGSGSGIPEGLEKALALPGVHLHIYGKEVSRKGRKMGHVTGLGETIQSAEKLAQDAADVLKFGKPE